MTMKPPDPAIKGKAHIKTNANFQDKYKPTI